MAKEFRVRFRHSAGDLGPFVFSKDTTITQVKDHVFSQWPKDGDFALDPPTSAGEIRLILRGKFLDDTRALFDYRKEMGDPDTDSIVTMHLVVRKMANSGKGGKQGGSCCACCSIQ
ncbi:unnamed protein product [Ostreobium quekettii]|uniref:UBL3-like ubiquitin domain-containing protein n=1 Tax=Ostreobium quekettii TaxID=121088 RepID=A0A8S1J1V1_9CHLO|nr:unnamed protein product [Ostreobium quekettii]|eukprot:evm.model.scf_1293EXC.7 EVM.evm.TU.scf_1293EXC.7   scf_1293EXC:34912-36861(-)